MSERLQGIAQGIIDGREKAELVRVLEDAIERGGLQARYLAELESLIIEAHREEIVLGWEILRATPEQRARAFLKVISQ